MGKMQTTGFGIEWHFLCKLIETSVPLDQEAVECHTWPFCIGVCMHACMYACVCMHTFCVCMHTFCVCMHTFCVCLCESGNKSIKRKRCDGVNGCGRVTPFSQSLLP